MGARAAPTAWQRDRRLRFPDSDDERIAKTQASRRVSHTLGAVRAARSSGEIGGVAPCIEQTCAASRLANALTRSGPWPSSRPSTIAAVNESPAPTVSTIVIAPPPGWSDTPAGV